MHSVVTIRHSVFGHSSSTVGDLLGMTSRRFPCLARQTFSETNVQRDKRSSRPLLSKSRPGRHVRLSYAPSNKFIPPFIGFSMASNRSRGVFAGFIFGFILVPGSVALHAWNEYRTIHRTRGLQEAERDVVTVDTELVAGEMDGKLVHLSGQAHTDEVLRDEEFGIRENAIHLKRSVEMFQWTESKRERDGDTRYDYDLEWRADRVNSESFHHPNGHRNPQPKYSSQTASADRVDLGAYQLNDTLRDQMKRWQPVEFNLDGIHETVGEEQAQHFVEHEGYLHWSAGEPRPNDPQLGDLRLTFQRVAPGDVSLMASLKGTSFETYRTSNGEKIERLYDGNLDGGRACRKTEDGEYDYCLGNPSRALFSWIPLVGDITGGLIFVVAALIGLSISLATIAISWIAVRPILGIALLAITAVAIYMLFKVRKSVQTEPAVIDSSMFVN
ncbi:transmembrane protein 43 homolog [Penaeus monodon]|uniref:transmembrane protein 43 homolog n=1 Tax=Penaeus monodon TaxID=6687 RepID=UPI0018A6E3B5|nr:transmembrane protein 43 homolog [Penaeus monodon]